MKLSTIILANGSRSTLKNQLVRRVYDKHELKRHVLGDCFDLPRYPSDEEVERAIHAVPYHFAQQELYLIANGAAPTTAALVAVTTGTAIKTMLQVKLGTQSKGALCEWGISFDGSAAATPGKIECIETGTVFATVTASVAADISKVGDPNGVDPTTSAFIVGTSSTGYTSTAEGTITATRGLDTPKFIAPTNQYEKQFPLGREPCLNVSTSTRIRVTFGAAVNCYCYMFIAI
jgi:hypothetical protein